jgi:protein translocase SecG subunit
MQITISVLIILFVLLQQTDEDSLSGIGAGASTKMLSKRSTSSPISKITMFLFILFMLNSMLLATISARSVVNNFDKDIEKFVEDENQKEKTIENLNKGSLNKK